MDDPTPPFFALPSNVALLRRLLLTIASWEKRPIEPAGVVHVLGQIIDLMVSNPDRFDTFASVNVEWIGKHFLAEVEECVRSPEVTADAVRSIFTSAFRFICELEFTQPGDSMFEIRRVIDFAHQHLEAFEGRDRQQLVYAAFTMPAQVAKKLIGHPAVVEFRKFSETVEASRRVKEEWDSDTAKREVVLQGLSENLKRITSEYNFVGLVHGFQRLKGAKEGERRFAFRSLVGVAAAMILLPSAQLTYVIGHLDVIESHKATLVYSLPTILTIEILLVYFFRVVLGHFRSVKAQLLQIDLRISICQFVESYADYISNLRAKDASALEKFEALIFSGLVAEDSGLPSSFDGVEQIAALIRSLRGAKG